jgi:large subunit ribosomal protein L7e
MSDDAAPQEDPQWGVSVLRPRNPGEDLKIQQAVLKKRDRNLEYQAQRARQIRKEVRARKNAQKPVSGIKQLESFLFEVQRRKQDLYRWKRVQKKKVRQWKVTNEKKGVIVAVRNMYKHAERRTKGVMRELRLAKPNHVVFLRNTAENLQKLESIKTFAYWGFPNKNLVTAMMQKKAALAQADEEQKTVVLSDNALVEEHLGHMGMLCVEDLVHEVYKAGPQFDDILRALKPFHVADTRTHEKHTRDKQCRTGHLGYGINDVVLPLVGGN